MVKVAFLFDQSNNWIKKYLPKDISKLKKFEFHEIYNEKEVRGFDLVFVLGYTKILKGEILETNKLILVVHESDLPKGRGFAPVQWQVLNGSRNITVCLLKVSEKADTGDICEKMILSLDGSELYDEIRYKQAQVTFRLIERFLKNYPNYIFTEQVGMPTFYRRRTPRDSMVDVDKTIRDQFKLLQVCNNSEWPAFFELNNATYILKIEKLE